MNSTFVWGPTWTTTLFADNRVSGLANIQITPELATKLATAYGAFLGRRRTVVISRDTHPASRMIKRAMIERARKVVALVDQSKFHNVQMFSFAAFDEIDVLVTDTRVDPDDVEILESHGMSVLRA